MRTGPAARPPEEPNMTTTYQPSLIARDDTFLGVCEGLGEDLRIPSSLLRLGFALALFFNPLAAVLAYLGAGVLVALSRLIAPNPRIPLPEPEAQAEAQAETVEEAQEELQPALPLAA